MKYWKNEQAESFADYTDISYGEQWGGGGGGVLRIVVLQEFFS